MLSLRHGKRSRVLRNGSDPEARPNQPINVLKHQLIHPRINEVLGRAGHHAKILIADGNYPASTKKGPNAEVVCMNLTPGVITVAQALRAILSAIPIDIVNTMGIPADDAYAK